MEAVESYGGAQGLVVWYLSVDLRGVHHVEHDLERELPAVAAALRGQVDVAADARLAVAGAARGCTNSLAAGQL